MRILLTLLILAGNGIAVAQDDEATRPIGFVRHLCPEGSDTWVATPFDHRTAEHTVALRGRPRVHQDRGTVIFYPERRQSWQMDEFVGSHYLRIAGDHDMAGRVYRLQSMTPTAIVVEYEDHFPDRDFARGDRVEIVAYPTLDDIFPPDTQTTFLISDGPLPLQRKTELLLFEDRPVDTTPTPSMSFFLTTDGWQQVTSGGVLAAGQHPLTPWTAMVVRNRAGLGDTEFLATGALPRYPQHRPVRSHWNEKFEVPTPAPNLIPTRLTDMQLSNRHGIFRDSESTDPGGRGSELLVFDNSATGFDKPPAARYFRIDGRWHLDDGSTYPVADDVEIEPGTSFSISKQRTWFRQWQFTTVNLQAEDNED